MSPLPQCILPEADIDKARRKSVFLATYLQFAVSKMRAQEDCHPVGNRRHDLRVIIDIGLAFGCDGEVFLVAGDRMIELCGPGWIERIRPVCPSSGFLGQMAA